MVEIGEIVNQRATYLAASTTTHTFLRTVNPFGNAMIDNITATLMHLNKTVWMLDNNQRGHSLKFQRFGSSNNFVKVTGRTYVDQVIVNPVQFPVFEQEVTDQKSISQIHTSLTRKSLVCESPTRIDITGNRVGVYLALIDIASTITHTIKPLLTGYNATTKKYKT